MKFTEILEELRKGKKVTREKWKTAVDACSVYFIVYNPKNGKCESYLDGRYDDDFVFVWDDITAEDWKIYKEKEKNKSWKPKEGDTYFYISGTGKVIYEKFMPCLPSDNDKVLFNNAFQTAEEAEYMVKKIKIINKLRELSTINFNDDCNKLHYIICYDIEKKQINYNVHHYFRESPFEVYFATEEDCVNAIKEIGEDNLKKYYFDITEVEEDK